MDNIKTWIQTFLAVIKIFHIVPFLIGSKLIKYSTFTTPLQCVRFIMKHKQAKFGYGLLLVTK